MSGTNIPPAAPAPRGLEGVVAAQTRLSHVDGLGGELIIAGYALKELAGRVSFEAAAHLLWKGALPCGARATPMTYQVTRGGKQFVVVCVGGGDEWGRGDYVVAFALP